MFTPDPAAGSADLLVLGATDVLAALDGREASVIDAVADAYAEHRAGRTQLSHAPFLRFGPDRPDRIIALPGRVGGDPPVAGIKWIASFPGNVRRGMARASAVLILNSTETGRPTVVMESSIVSARRTAASAALAARLIHPTGDETALGLVGCGVINFEVARFVRYVAPRLETLCLYDLDPARAATFAARVANELGATDDRPRLSCEVVADANQVFERARLVSFATVATAPHVSELPWTPRHTVLHLSLRDLAPSLVLAADNIADDMDHVVQAGTSLHLTEQETGHREFLRCNLADILAGEAEPRPLSRPVVFSPFGLGVLDLVIGRMVLGHARRYGAGVQIPDFLPAFTG